MEYCTCTCTMNSPRQLSIMTLITRVYYVVGTTWGDWGWCQNSQCKCGGCSISTRHRMCGNARYCTTTHVPPSSSIGSVINSVVVGVGFVRLCLHRVFCVEKKKESLFALFLQTKSPEIFPLKYNQAYCDLCSCCYL